MKKLNPIMIIVVTMALSCSSDRPYNNELYQELPRSKLGIFPKAAVVSDAETCASHGV